MAARRPLATVESNGLQALLIIENPDSPRIMRGKENRYLAYGKTNAGRFLLVVLIIANRNSHDGLPSQRMMKMITRMTIEISDSWRLIFR